jgi:hypothetical protein
MLIFWSLIRVLNLECFLSVSCMAEMFAVVFERIKGVNAADFDGHVC